jgi:enoyl-CoA hydratase/carnithine racemase
MSTTAVIIEDRYGVRHLVLNRPEKKNALTTEMYAALADAIASAEADGIGALLLRAVGGTFTAGNDLRDFLANPPAGNGSPVFRFMEAFASTDVPVVAAVRGAAIGIGLTMLLHCDVVLAGPDARLRVPFLDLGVVPENASSVLLPRIMGRARAGAMLYLGETLDAHDARADGIVSQIVADAELDAAAEHAARAIAAKPREAVRATKRLLAHDRAEIIDAIRREGKIFGERLASDEARSVMAAFFSGAARG